jgi:hypothetical protein
MNEITNQLLLDPPSNSSRYPVIDLCWADWREEMVMAGLLKPQEDLTPKEYVGKCQHYAHEGQA